MFRPFLVSLVSLAALLVAGGTVRACPFCQASTQTFSEEITSMDAVVIAKLVEAPPPPKTAADEVAKSKFEILQVIKGKEHLGSTKTIETVYFGEPIVGGTFMITAVDPPKLMWSTPLLISKRARDYLTHLLDLPADGPERLTFFQNYLEDKDEMLARDAYDEFARAPYDMVKSLKKNINHDKVLEWIRSTDVPASRRRLYLTMLGVCGDKKDLPMLEEMLRSDDRKVKGGLDAMIACYLTLKGPDGMPLIEDLFLKNKKAEYADTYAAIMALRFHGDQDTLIPRKRLLAGLRYMLDRPQLADLVIPDLAKWEDWSAMDKLVELFRDADEKSSWVRVPVINYLRACPLPEAKKRIKELEKIDPESVKRANTFFPAPAGNTPAATQSSSISAPADQPVAAKTPQKPSSAVVASASGGQAVSAAAGRQVAARTVRPALENSSFPTPNLFAVFGVPLVAGVFLVLLQWSILCGAGRGRASS